MSDRNEAKEVFFGTMTVLLCNAGIIAGLVTLWWLLGFGRIYFLHNISLALVAGISITQLLYAIPLCVRLKKRGHTERFKGAVIGMLITAFLNGSCFVFAFWLLSQLH